jgi:hypothetical protein
LKELKYLKEQITFEKVKNTYDRLLLDKENRRMGIFRTFAEKYSQFALMNEYEN